MEIIEEGREYFKANGISQWQRGYPSRETLVGDYETEKGYVYIDENGEIVGTFCLDFDACPDYLDISEGNFHSDLPYAAIHRIAVKQSFKGRGIGGEIVDFAAKECLSRGIKWLRVDTHEKNLSMQRMLTKKGFRPCGIIYVDEIHEEYYRRIAFDLELEF